MAFRGGAGTAKCEIEIKIKFQNSDENVLRIQHERISPLSFAKDPIAGDIIEVADDIIEYMKNSITKSNCKSIVFKQIPLSQNNKMKIVLKDGTTGNIYFEKQDSINVYYKRTFDGNSIILRKNMIKEII